jgi:hypothetical protein
MKYIKVTGCHDCPCAATSWTHGTLCGRRAKRTYINSCVGLKTIHPDCPLDDYDELDELPVEVIDRGEQDKGCHWKRIRFKCEQNLRGRNDRTSD